MSVTLHSRQIRVMLPFKASNTRVRRTFHKERVLRTVALGKQSEIDILTLYFTMRLRWLLILTGILSLSWTCESQRTGLLCKNGGTCSPTNTTICEKCDCPDGFGGNDCSVILIKISGTISFEVNEGYHGEFNKTLFQIRLSNIFPNYDSSDVTPLNSTLGNVINFVVYIERPSDTTNFNITMYQIDVRLTLMENETAHAAFPKSSFATILSARIDVDECASNLVTCPDHKSCYNTDQAYGCSCVAGFSEENGTCIELYCLLDKAPAWPPSARRSVRFPNGSGTISGNKMPFKTFIVYECPDHYTLVSSASKSKDVDVIECVGTLTTTEAQKNGWTGSEVRCDMTVEFMVAIIVATISSAIIVMLLGAFIVGCTKQKKSDPPDDTIAINQ